MGYKDRQYSQTPGEASGGVNPANPIDDIVAGLIDAATAKGRGFTLGVVPTTGANGERATRIEFVESLRPVDERLRLADYRDHVIRDSASLITYAQKYGTQEKSIVFVGEVKTVLVIDDTVERGLRERLHLLWRPSQQWKDWSGILDMQVDHKAMLKFMQTHEDDLDDASMLVDLQRVSSSATVNIESDVGDTGNEIKIGVKTTKGDGIAKFPKDFAIRIPVLDEDNDVDEELDDVLAKRMAKRAIKISVEIIMPDAPMKPITFRLYTSKWQSTWRDRIRAEEKLIRSELTGWLVLKGVSSYESKEVGGDEE